MCFQYYIKPLGYCVPILQYSPGIDAIASIIAVIKSYCVIQRCTIVIKSVYKTFE